MHTVEDPELQHLMGAYYHEDFETLWSGLELYLEDDSPEDHRRLLTEVDEVLGDSSRSVAQLGALLHDLGCYALLDDFPGGYRGWLEEIAQRVRTHLRDQSDGRPTRPHTPTDSVWKTKFSELTVLIEAYYHLDFDDVWGSLDDYLANSTTEKRSALTAEIAVVLRTHQEDVAVEYLLGELGNYVDRSGTPGGYRGWLEEIARRVRAHLGD